MHIKRVGCFDKWTFPATTKSPQNDQHVLRRTSVLKEPTTEKQKPW